MSCALRRAAAHTLRRAKTLRAPRYRGQRQFWSDMPAGASGTRWFEELFGFREGNSYRENRAKFRMEGDVLCVDGGRSKSISWAAGPRLAANCARSSALSTCPRRLAEPLILDERNAGAVFQAASQFNALEMVGPGVSTRIACYSNDPRRALRASCPGGTVFRNYLVNETGQGDRQIDLLRTSAACWVTRRVLLDDAELLRYARLPSRTSRARDAALLPMRRQH